MFEFSHISGNKVGYWLNNLYWMEVVVELQLFNSIGQGLFISNQIWLKSDEFEGMKNPLKDRGHLLIFGWS